VNENLSVRADSSRLTTKEKQKLHSDKKYLYNLDESLFLDYENKMRLEESRSLIKTICSLFDFIGNFFC